MGRDEQIMVMRFQQKGLLLFVALNVMITVFPHFVLADNVTKPSPCDHRSNPCAITGVRGGCLELSPCDSISLCGASVRQLSLPTVQGPTFKVPQLLSMTIRFLVG